ncbi:MAG: hemerythrin domain-containing protein [Proteobacteria bacterium]|nr:hemerythrin domain-containing protein [Pseudomonadota bacterium]
MSKRINYFQTIHKAIRRLLFLLSIDLGAVDMSDLDEVKVLYERFEHLKAYLESHAHHEENHIHALIKAKLPELYAVTEREHQEQEGELDKLAKSFKDLLAINNSEQRIAAGYTLYLQFNQFVSSYCTHLWAEEGQIMPGLWQTCTDEELLKHFLSLMASFTQEEYFDSLDKFWPAINKQEKTAMVALPSGLKT